MIEFEFTAPFNISAKRTFGADPENFGGGCSSDLV